MRNLLLLPIVALLVVGCLPDRDNKRDPANTPTALLVIRAMDLAEGETCEVTDALLNSAEAVAITPRGRCLVLDARNSFDPQGTAVSYAFLLPEEVQTDCNISQTIDSGDRDVVVIPPATQQCIATNEIRTLYVRVRDASGADGHAEASLVLTNSEPVAATRESRSLPVGGSRWAVGAPYDIVFDGGESFDAEGDELEYCWTLPGESEVCDQSPVRVLPGVPSSSPIRVTARLRVTDNRVLLPDAASRGRKLSSYSIPATVAIEQPVLWSAASDTIVRHDVDPPITSSLANVATATILPASVTQTVDRLLVGAFDDSVRLANLATRTPIGAATVPVTNNDLQLLIPDPAGGRVFGIGQNEVANQPEGPSIVLWEWTVNEAAASPLVATAAPILRVIHGSAGAANFFEATGTIQPDGTLWFGAYGGSELLRFSTAGALEVLDLGDDLGEIALRPGAGDEIWVLTTSEPGDPLDTVSRLLVFRTGLVPVREINLGNVGSGSLVWVDEFTFWLSLPGGLSLVDVRLLDDGAAIEDAVLFTVEAVQNFQRRLVLDDATGTVWLTSQTGAGFRVRRSGSARLFPVFNSRFHFVDGNGRAWYSDPAASYTLRASYAPDPNLARELLLTGQGIASEVGAIDPLAGSIWFATNSPTGLVEVADDGTIRRTEDTAIINGELRGIPRLAALSAIAERRALWGYRSQTQTAYLFDVSTRPPSAKTFFSPDTLGGGVFHAFVPDASGTPGRLWTLRTATNSIALLDTSGQFTPVFAIPEILNADGVYSARSAFSNRLCLATRTGSLLLVRWISPDGTVINGQFSPLSLDADTTVSGIAIGATSGNGGEQCFVATVRNVGGCFAAGTLSVYGWNSVGSLTRTGSYAPGAGAGLTGYNPSFVARTADDLRLHMSNCPGGQPQSDEIVLTWNGNAYTAASKPTFGTALVSFE